MAGNSRKVILDQTHTISASNKIIKICKPLETISVKLFRYSRIFKDGSRIILSNLPDVFRYLYEEGNYIYTWLDRREFPKEYLNRKKILWALERTDSFPAATQKIAKDLGEYFSLHEGIAYIRRNQNFVEVFDFVSQDQSVYFMEEQSFQRFMFYFRDAARKEIEKATEERIYLPENIIDEFPISEHQILGNDFYTQTKTKRYYLSGEFQDRYLTRRELVCLNWTIRGKTADEAAVLMKLKRRSVEKLLEKIKEKLNCSRQIQLMGTAYQQGLILNFFELD